MEWLARTPSLWEWENFAILNGRTTPKYLPVDLEIEGSRIIENGAVYSSGGGDYSGSELGNGASSRGSTSTSINSSSKSAAKVPEFNFQAFEDTSKDLSKKKQSAWVADTISSPDLVASAGSGEPLIGLKLGKRTYFEDVCAGNSAKNSTFTVVSTPSVVSTKKTKIAIQSIQSHCQVQGCSVDLTTAKDYHRRHRVCVTHSKCPRVVVAGLERRFCQQCSRFHDLSEFDDKKRSCRKRLSDHNARRRKSQPGTISFNSARMSTSFYDGKQHMNFSLTRPPVAPERSSSNDLWEGDSQFKFVQMRDLCPRPPKVEGDDGQMLLVGGPPASSSSVRHHDSDRPMPLKSSTSDAPVQGLDTSALTSTLEATPDFCRALSLLSHTSSWDLHDPAHGSLDQLFQTSMPPPAMNLIHQDVRHSSPYDWQSGLPSQALHGNCSQFQEFQLFKSPCTPAFFGSHSMP